MEFRTKVELPVGQSKILSFGFTYVMGVLFLGKYRKTIGR